ncbi:MAG TPA: hypothetical protein PLM16_01300 [Candidatus Woesebacteria bacterium]|nr:hypothetical protein [Candidatus Woesebacteria bacterium]
MSAERVGPDPQESQESPIPVIVPRTAMGEFAGFKDPDPRTMAHNFGQKIPPLAGKSERYLALVDSIVLRLIQLSLCFPQLSSTLINLLAELELNLSQDQAAKALNATFGEVKPEDRKSLPVVAVKHALEHNVAETDSRVLATTESLSALLQRILIIIAKEQEAIQKQIAVINMQQAQDIQAEQTFKENVASGYQVNAPRVQEAVVFTQKLSADDQNRLHALKLYCQQLTLLELSIWRAVFFGAIFNEKLANKQTLS